MGGTMEWARMRSRNGLGIRKMEGDPYGVILEPWMSETVGVRMLLGEMNRLEQSYMGVYYEGQTDLAGIGAGQAGITRDQALALFRWFFELPEPGCGKCQEQVARTTLPGQAVHQRCYEHTWSKHS